MMRSLLKILLAAALVAVASSYAPPTGLMRAPTSFNASGTFGSFARGGSGHSRRGGGGGEAAAVRRTLRAFGAGTYIDDILLSRDSALVRWPDRVDDPLRVWIQPTSAVPDFRSSFVGKVRSAFDSWQALRIPVRFVFVPDSAGADVHVTWIDHFKEEISGRTHWARDDHWWITDANIVLAIHHNHGEPLDNAAVRAMALHEVGHLLGLDHCQDSTNIMAPTVHVRDLTAADRATVRLLYSLPPGPVR